MGRGQLHLLSMLALFGAAAHVDRGPAVVDLGRRALAVDEASFRQAVIRPSWGQSLSLEQLVRRSRQRRRARQTHPHKRHKRTRL